jgi:serine/threonine protein phosphatase 1
MPQLSSLQRFRVRGAMAAAGERVYAIGDIHGRFDLLHKLLVLIDQDNQGRPKAHCKIIILGDFIDRGQDSSKVIALLRAAQEQTTKDRFIVLLGNHEAVMLDVLLRNAEALHFWLNHGGQATLASFEIAPPGLQESASDFAARIAQGLTQDVVDWIRNLPLTAQSGDYFFCHAGVRPGVPLVNQSREDLLWIRNEFLQTRHRLGAVVVHGHSPSGKNIEFCDHRIGIDTGAYATGILSSVGFEEDRKWVLSTTPSSRQTGSHKLAASHR